MPDAVGAKPSPSTLPEELELDASSPPLKSIKVGTRSTSETDPSIRFDSPVSSGSELGTRMSSGTREASSYIERFSNMP